MARWDRTDPITETRRRPNRPLIRLMIVVGHVLLCHIHPVFGFQQPNYNRGTREHRHTNFLDVRRTEPFGSMQRFVLADVQSVDAGQPEHADLYKSYESQLTELALLTTNDESIAEQALNVLDRMRQESIVDTHIYSILLNILAFSKHSEALEKAESIFDSLRDETDTSTPQPDTEVYCAALELFMQHCGPDRCQELVDSIADVTIPIHNKLIQAYGKHRQVDEAVRVFESMGNNRDTKTFVQIIRSHRHATMDKRRTLWEQHIPERSLATYNAYLQAVSEPDEADVVFYEMLASQIQPDDDTIFQMLRAYKQGVPSFRIRQVLVHRSKAVESSSTASERTRNAALLALKRSPSKDLSLDLIQSLYATTDPPRMQRLALFCCSKIMFYTTDADDADADAAAAAAAAAAVSKQEAFQWALELYKNNNSDGNLHGTFLYCVSHLLAPSQKRDAVARTVLERAQKDGKVDGYLLRQFRLAASEAAQLQVFGGFLDEMGSIPEEWRRNVVTY